LIGRPLPFEQHDCSEIFSLSKPVKPKRLFTKPSNSTAETRKMLMFSDRFYEGASQINAIVLKPRSHRKQSIVPSVDLGCANESLVENSREQSDEVFDCSDQLFSVEEFCKDAVKQARSMSESWRRRKKALVAGGMPSDKSGLLAESSRLKSAFPLRLHPVLKHQPKKSTRPLKDESSNDVANTDSAHIPQEVDFWRETFTSSGLHSSSSNTDLAHPSFATEKCFESHEGETIEISATETRTSDYQPNLSLGHLGVLNAAARHSSIKSPSRSWTPRHTKTPELKQNDSFSEPLKTILKEAYDRRAAESMFCQLYLKEHIKNFENSKSAAIQKPESMNDIFIDDNTQSFSIADIDVGKHATVLEVEVPSQIRMDSITTKPITHSSAKLGSTDDSILIPKVADKMGRPPAKPNMARENIKLQKETIKAIEMASIPRHKKLDWSALTPEEFKQKRNAEMQALLKAINMPDGCWEVASWFR
jgi:hypothetical protein